MVHTAEATVWFGVAESEPTKLGRVNPWHRDVSDANGDVSEEHVEYLSTIGLYVVKFGNGVTDRERCGLCLSDNFTTLSSRVGPLVTTLKQWQHIPHQEWVELLQKARWVGTNAPRVYFTMLTT